MHRLRSYLFAVWFLALCASQGLAANVRWTGNAQDVKQVSTIAVSGTWASGDTATLTINKKSLTVTIGAAVATTDVAAALSAAVDASSATADLVGTESRNFGGAEIPEFIEIEADASGSTLTLSSATAGVPFTVTRTEVTAGTGALGAVTAVTVATGKNWLSNADNYDGAALPVDNDTLYIDVGSASILYALDYFRTNSIDLTIYISNDWTGQLGLPLLNASGYVEYRTPRYFQFRGGAKALHFIPGITGVGGQGKCWIDLTDQAAVRVNVNANRGNTTAPNVFIAGADATTLTNSLYVTEGSVSVEPDDAPTASTKMASFGTIVVGTPGGSATTPIVMIGRNTRLVQTATSTLEILSGSVTSYAPTLNGADECIVYVYGGEARMRGVPHWKYVIREGTLLPGGNDDGAIEEIQQFGGVVDFREANSTHAVADFDVHAGSTIYDPDRRGVTDLDLIGCRLDQITLELPANRHVDVATEATP